jgi:hypothetical protein
MAGEMTSIDITHNPELRRLAEEVRTSRKPRILVNEGRDVAVLKPVSPTRRRPGRGKTEADHQAFRSSAGAWRGNVDVDKFLEELEESRRLTTPPVEV